MFCSVKLEAQVMYVSSVTVQDIGRVNAMHGRSGFGCAIIANRNLKRSNKPNGMKGHVERRNATAVVVSGVEERVTGRTNVTHVFRDGERINTTK
jgi:hypothetical protein